MFADQSSVLIQPACIETGDWNSLVTPYDVTDALSLTQPVENEL